MSESIEWLEKRMDDTRIVSVVFCISFYFKKNFKEFPESILYCLDRFLDVVPENEIKYYRTESMSAHKLLKRSPLKMLSSILNPSSSKKKIISLELKNGNDYRETPNAKFRIYGSGADKSKGYKANVMNLSFPAQMGCDMSSYFIDFVQDICNRTPYICGHAGYSFECSPYLEKISNDHAWSKSMRHRGIDISMRSAKEAIAVKHDGLKTVSWITVLSSELIDDIDSEKITELNDMTIKVVRVKNGILIIAGSHPEIGDRNKNVDDLGNYRRVYKVVEPLVEKASSRSPFITLSEEKEDKTLEFFTRLSK